MSFISSEKGQELSKMTSREYLMWTGIGLFIIAMIILFVFELPHFNNTFGLGIMVFMSFVLGIGSGIWIFLRIKDRLDDLIDRVRVASLLCVGFIFVIFLSSHLLNRNILISTPRTETYPFLQHELYRRDGVPDQNGKVLVKTYVQIENDFKRFVSRGELYEEGKQTRQVEIPVQRGLLGFKVANIPLQ